MKMLRNLWVSQISKHFHANFQAILTYSLWSGYHWKGCLLLVAMPILCLPQWKNLEVFLYFVDIVSVRVCYLDFFVFFIYVTGECHRFSHQGRVLILVMAISSPLQPLCSILLHSCLVTSKSNFTLIHAALTSLQWPLNWVLRRGVRKFMDEGFTYYFY